MFYVMESKNDVIISAADQRQHNESVGFKVVGSRKSLKGAQKLAEKRTA
ncbi:hypothetical protein ACFCP7_27230 [Paenibacillus elgii]